VRGLLVDFGGVLTTNVFESFRAFCVDEGLGANAFANLFRDPSARTELRKLETGGVTEDEFGKWLGAQLGVANTEGLVDRLFARIEPDDQMVDAVRKARRSGVQTALVSNSMGSGRYDRESFPELFDAVVISGEVGVHKPEPEIYRLACERLDLPPTECVLVDDLRENCEGAEAVGIAAILHRGAERTLPELERLLGVELR
jgi:epoxide hydrolase-like predicted phosphatase